MSIHIRPARESDTALILTLIRQLAEFEKLLHEVTTTEEQLRNSLFGPGAVPEVLIAERDGRGVGFALFFANFSTFLGKPGIYLEDLFVQPLERSGGIGLKLLQAIAKIALERGCGRLEWSVLDWNERALAFYRRLGAKPQSEWTVQRLTETEIRALANSSAH
ncbi:MAG: N-acetyltransferase family protein [Bdellovibrionota bacterium]